MKEIPDQETRIAAVLTGTVDFLDVVSSDFYQEALDNADQVAIHIGIPGAQPDVMFNTRNPLLGFSESGRKIRQAVQAAVNAEDVMKGYGDPRLWQLCPSLQMCGTPLGGAYRQRGSLQPERRRARQETTRRIRLRRRRDNHTRPDGLPNHPPDSPRASGASSLRRASTPPSARPTGLDSSRRCAASTAGTSSPTGTAATCTIRWSPPTTASAKPPIRKTRRRARS